MRTKRFIVLIAVFLFVSLFFVQIAAATGGWLEDSGNPVFDPVQRTYYPCVVYDANKFSGHGESYYYKMWYTTVTGGPYATRLAYSDDGKNWVEQDGDLSVLTNAAHAIVLYNANGFSEGIYYKMWYQDGSTPYGPIRYAESGNGVTWINDQAIGEDPAAKLVAGWVAPYWFYSSYGAGAVLYNTAGYAALNYADPMGNKYVMYYDAASQGYAPDGTTEGSALAFSADGKYWARYGSEPVLKASGGSAWDSGYAYVWAVLKISGHYEMYYSGGQAASNAGIGYAESVDGITWTKQANPVMHVSDGVSWRSGRTYTPSVIYDASQFSGHGDTALFKMWYTGVSGGSNYAVGYAYIPSMFVTPENPIGVLGALLACILALTLFKFRKNKHRQS